MFRLKKSKSRGLDKYGANKKYRRVSSRVSASFSAAAQFNNLVIENIFQRFQLAFKMPLASHHLSDFIPNSTEISKKSSDMIIYCASRTRRIYEEKKHMFDH